MAKHHVPDFWADPLARLNGGPISVHPICVLDREGVATTVFDNLRGGYGTSGGLYVFLAGHVYGTRKLKKPVPIISVVIVIRALIGAAGPSRDHCDQVRVVGRHKIGTIAARRDHNATIG